MILSDRSIKDALRAGRIVIEPYDEGCVQPASVDLRMGRLFRVFRNHTAGTIDVKLDQADLTELIEVPEDGVFMLHPGEFVLGSTHERVGVGDDLVGPRRGEGPRSGHAHPDAPWLADDGRTGRRGPGVHRHGFRHTGEGRHAGASGPPLLAKWSSPTGR